MALLVAGCSASPAPGAGQDSPLRLLVAGAVDLTGAVAAVAEADPEGLFREVRLPARRADLAIVVAAPGEAWDLLAAAGFDAAVCPQERELPLPATTPAVNATVALRCVGRPALRLQGFRIGALAAPHLSLAVVEGSLGSSRAGADVMVAVPGESLSVAVITLPFGRSRLVVSGFGSLLSPDPTGRGAVLEVLADRSGVIAYRLGRVTHADFRVHFAGWDLPHGDAVLLDGEWWALARPAVPAAIRPPPESLVFTYGDLVAAAVGDITGDGVPDLAASYRHPFRSSTISEARPGTVGIDSLGRSAHLGVFTLEGQALWAAGYIPRPVGRLAACDGGVALAYTGLDDPAVVAAGAGIWRGLSLEAAPELPGRGFPGCADVDGDGRLDPVIVGRVG